MSNRPDRLFEVECPDCKTTLTIDPRTRKIFHSVSKDDDGNTRSFEDAVKDATAGPQKAEKVFEEGLAAEEGKDERLDELFDEGLKKAEEDPNKKPPSIFDFD